MKIKISTIMGFLMFHIIFVDIKYFAYYNYFIYGAMICMTIFLITKISILKGKYKKINLTLFLLIAFIIISSISNGLNAHRGIMYSIKIIEVFLFFEYINEKMVYKDIIKLFFRLTLFYCIINDITIILLPNLFSKYVGYYLIGNKFTVAYFHIFLMMLYQMENRKKSRKKYFSLMFFIWSVIISAITSCSTALVGTFIFFILTCIPKEMKKVLISGKVIIIVLLISANILLVFSGLLQNKYVQSFVVEILHEDVELNGRMRIYEDVIPLIEKKLMIGYGFGNTYEILEDRIAAVNTQNGLLENIFDYGVIATIISLILIYLIVNLHKKENNIELTYPLIVYLYVFIILASVEITFDIIFWGIVSFLIIQENTICEREKLNG